MFNVFNEENWYTSNKVYTYSDFGELNQLAGDPRTFQIGAKFHF